MKYQEAKLKVSDRYIGEAENLLETGVELIILMQNYEANTDTRIYHLSNCTAIFHREYQGTRCSGTIHLTGSKENLEALLKDIKQNHPEFKEIKK